MVNKHHESLDNGNPDRSRSAWWKSAGISVVIVVAALILLRIQGRVWWCDCRSPALWSGDAWGPHNSQHLFDPYSFTHIEHGFLFCGLLIWILPRWSAAWQFCLGVLVESAWEVLENSSMVIERFRAATAAQGYTGDSIANSVGDVLSCMLGFWLARRFGVWRTVLMTAVMELILVVWIRDNLAINILMLIAPVDAIKAWQSAGQ